MFLRRHNSMLIVRAMLVGLCGFMLLTGWPPP
jgi:hypothetical protein